jgi:dGTPase
MDQPVAAFSAALAADNAALKSFLFERMYRHWRVNRMTSRARRVVADLFSLLFREPECLPDDWRTRAASQNERGRARVVADYIAGMTDNYAFAEHRRLFDLHDPDPA